MRSGPVKHAYPLVRGFFLLLVLLPCAALRAKTPVLTKATSVEAEKAWTEMIGDLDAGRFEVAAPKLQAASEAGDADARYLLGVLAYLGAGVELDGAKARALWRDAADRACEIAASTLASIPSGEKDAAEEQARWARQAAALHPSSLAMPAFIHREEARIRFDSAPALAWMKRGAEAHQGLAVYNLALAAMDRQTPAEHVALLVDAGFRGYAPAYYRLAVYYQLGIIVARNPLKRAAYLESAATLGHAEAAYELGECYHKGEGLTKSSARAAQWYQRAIDAGHAAAACRLADMYDEGDGVSEDPAKAVELYRFALEHGCTDSLDSLAWHVEKGRGTPQDLPKAVELYRQSAGAGSTYAMRQMGRIYRNGISVTADPAEAVNWFRQAAEKGDDEGMFQLGKCYYSGTGVEKDPQAGFEWLEKSAQKGNAAAQADVGWALLHGSGIEQDDEEGVHWLELAEEKGSSVAAVLLAKYISQLPREDPRQRKLPGLKQRAEKRHDERALLAVADAFIAQQDQKAAMPLYEQLIASADPKVALPAKYQVALNLLWHFTPADGDRLNQLVSDLRNAGYPRSLTLQARVWLGSKDEVMIQKGVALLEQPEAQNDAAAIYFLAMCFALGHGKTQDLDKAHELLIKASEYYPSAKAKAKLPLEELAKVPSPFGPFPSKSSSASPTEEEIQKKIAALPAVKTGPPRLVYSVAPVYPITLKRREKKGFVNALIHIASDGRVAAVDVLETTDPALADAVKKAVLSWRFAPAMKDGAACASTAQQHFDFSIH